MDNDVISFNFDVIIILLISFATIRNPLSYKTENRIKNSLNGGFILLFWVKLLFLSKNADFLLKKKKKWKAAKLRRPWYWKVNFLKLHKCVYLSTKFQVCINILISLKTSREGAAVVILPHSHRRETLKSPS